ncbi:MAG: right-handed parallel beta-helix repeat-containing protein [Phycisphaerales bacterium]|nr:right-handed parallel beta-helix repeat-containing protein [Phycisphaerales bacterium]
MRRVIAFCIALAPASASAAVINVPADHATIQAAINASVNGDEIIVAPGTYNESINPQGKAITIRSADPTDPAVVQATIIDPLGVNAGVICVSGETANTVFSGFTITGGSALTGGGMANVSSSPTVRRCVFVGNSASNLGGGMYNTGGSSPTIEHCIFIGNTSTSHGGAIYVASGSPKVTNCAFIGNIAGGQGGGLYVHVSSPSVTNCTFTANTATGGGALSNNNSSNTTVTNCTLWGDAPSEITNFNSPVPVVTYCNVQGGSAGAGNINANPLFVDADGSDNVFGTLDDNVRLSASSPCIDAANNGAPGLVGITTDLDILPRFVDDPAVADTGAGSAPIVDMGAYEFQASGPAPVPTLNQWGILALGLLVLTSGTLVIRQASVPSGAAA